MVRFGLSIDLDVCTGCGACTVACAQENNVPPGVPEEGEGRLIRWMEIHLVEDERSTGVHLVPMPCQHCDHPPCTTVCPVYATYRTPEGLVPQTYAQCIGCRYCVNACPYTCKHFNWSNPEWPEPMTRGLNPDVSVRSRGVTEKCNFCLHRIQIAREAASIAGRSFRANDVRTACQEVCPTRAIAFGDLDDPSNEVAERAREKRATRLLEDLGTDPKVVYLKERA